MAATEGNDGPPLTELESLQLKANQVTDESLESTRRMIALCEDVSNHFTTSEPIRNQSLSSQKILLYLISVRLISKILFLFIYFVSDSQKKRELKPWSH